FFPPELRKIPRNIKVFLRDFPGIRRKKSGKNFRVLKEPEYSLSPLTSPTPQQRLDAPPSLHRDLILWPSYEEPLTIIVSYPQHFHQQDVRTRVGPSPHLRII